jgi:hypothetical protein
VNSPSRQPSRAPIIIGIAASAIVVAILLDALARAPVHNPQPKEDTTAEIDRSLPYGGLFTSMNDYGRLPAKPWVDTRPWQWVQFQGMLLPSSPTDGPRQTVAGLAAGYTRTPAGALLAAINIYERVNALAGSAIFRPTFTHQVYDVGNHGLKETNDFYDEFKAGEVSYLKAAYAGGPLAQRDGIRYLGYRWKDFNGAEAVVDVLTTIPDGKGVDYWVARLHVIWLKDDWLLWPPCDYCLWTDARTRVMSDPGFTRFFGRGSTR